MSMKPSYSLQKFQEKHPLLVAGLTLSAWSGFLIWIHLLLYTSLRTP